MRVGEHDWKRTAPRTCPTCGTVCDAASRVRPGGTSPGPRVGDVSICLYCGSILQFAEGDRLEPVERPEELPGITAEDLEMLRGAAEAVRRWRAAKQH